MSEHFNIIRRNCDKVIAEVQFPFPGIYYWDGDFGYAEFDTPSGIAYYYCDSMEDFQKLCETVTEDDGDFIDDFDEPDDLECGFDPYEGCYTFDC